MKRLIATALFSTILLQQIPVSFAQTTRLTSTVDILGLEESNNGANITFAPLAEGLLVTARVDNEGRGDFLTIQSALAQIKTGVIIVSSGIYNEHNLVVPDGVLVRGGYDSRSWQKTAEDQTIVLGSKHAATFILQKASALQNIVLRQAETAVRVAYGPATISQIAIADSKKAIELSPYSTLRIAHSDFVKNEIVLAAHTTSKVSIVKSLFQNNGSILNQPIDTASSITESSFFPAKGNLQDIQERDTTVLSAKPLAGAEMQLPAEENSNSEDFSFDFSQYSDSKVQTIAGPTIQTSRGVNAALVYYQLSEGDEIRIVDRSNFSSVVFETKGEERQFRGWIFFPESTELVMLLDTNGDNFLPLQAGINQTALIPNPNFRTNSNLGMFSQSDEADWFYRLPIQSNIDQLTEAQKQLLARVDTPVILGGEEWLPGSRIETDSKENSLFYKGFVNKILLEKNLDQIAPANRNTKQTALRAEDPRFFSLLADYLAFKKPAILPNNTCSTEADCPFEIEGLAKFLPIISYPLTSESEAVENTGGLYNNEGWNAPNDSNAKLSLELPKSIDHFTASWSFQPLIVTPGSEAHIITFFSEDEDKNSIALFMTPNGNIAIKALDQSGTLHTLTTQEVTWDAGRKYLLTMETKEGSVRFGRDDGIILWQESVGYHGLKKIAAGKIDNKPAAGQIMKNLHIWENESTNQTFFKSSTSTLSASLDNAQASLSGAIYFQKNNVCANNSLQLKEGENDFANVSGTIEGDKCKLTLRSPLLSTSAEAIVPIAKLEKPLHFLWQWNPVAVQGTLSLLNDDGFLLSTLPTFGSTPITQAFSPRNISIQGSTPFDNVYLRYHLLPAVSNRNLTRLINIERYEVLFSDTEDAVRTGTATRVPVIITDIRDEPTLAKEVNNLESGKRYYFAVRAILENGGSTDTSQIRNLLISGSERRTELSPGSLPETNLPSTLALESNHQLNTVYAQENTSTSTTSAGGSVLPGHLGEPLSLSNATNSQNQLTAWSLGKDLSVSANPNPKHIYTSAGQYIITQIRNLKNGNSLKQFGLVAIAPRSSDRVRINAEVWTASLQNPAATWTNKNIGKKIPAIVASNEPIYLLGSVTDIAGSTADTYTWTYQVDWGDGSTDTNDIAKNAFNRTRLVNGQKEETPLRHIYARPGIYTIVTQVQDTEGNIGAFENTVVVTGLEAYPQRITSLRGISRLITISGGMKPYTVKFIDNSTQTLAPTQTTFILPITENGSIEVRDALNNSTIIEITLTADPKENFEEVYLPADRGLETTPASAKTGDTIVVKSKNEEHLELLTDSLSFQFGDVLPPYLTRQIPELNTTLTFGTDDAVRTDPFLNMGNFPAILSSIALDGSEEKKAVFLDIGKARLGVQSNSGIVTGSVPTGLHVVPNSVEVWQRGVTPVQLANLTPNSQGRFIYIVPAEAPKHGVLGIRIKDQKGQTTNFAQNINYSTVARPEKLFGILETNGSSPLFTTKYKLATNAEKPTFFGFDKNNNQQTLRIASEDPTEYVIKPDVNGSWILESEKTLEEGNHTFSLIDKNETMIEQYNFQVDRTAPQKPTINYASWSQLHGKAEPFAFVGIMGNGDQSEQYIQADSQGDFQISFPSYNTRYVLAVADEAGNVSPLVQITEKEWHEQETISLWQKIRPYLFWSLLIVLAASGITYARKIKV